MAITRRLPCNLNDEDLLDRGKQLANAEKDYTTVEDEKREAMRDFKKSLDAIQGRIDELSTAIRDKIETRDVECTVSNNFQTMRKEISRNDTGEVVETYEMSESERQGQLL